MIVVGFTVDGGLSYTRLTYIAANAYRTPGLVSIALPPEARTPSTMFALWQPTHDQGATDDLWVR